MCASKNLENVKVEILKAVKLAQSLAAALRWIRRTSNSLKKSSHGRRRHNGYFNIKGADRQYQT